MKNLTKIFTAVVAGMFALSCVTDTTNDLAPELGLDKGQTTLTVSLEESRTHLGEKVGDLYKLLWSEGDKIAVNGQPSISIAINEEYPSAATFTFDEPGVTRPFAVVYPAPEVMPIAEEGESNEGGTGESEPATPTEICPVTFLGTQTWEDGTFCEGAAPMYGYAEAPAEGEEAAAIQLQHLAGVLRIAPKGSVVLKGLTVKSEKGAIAGPFMVDCTTGALTAQEGASNTINVDFGAGLTLDPNTATPIYVAVPAGNYGTFLITLRTDSDKMTVKFNSDVKPINAGYVREFSEFVYAANTLEDETADFLITDEDALVEFAKIANAFYPRTSAKVTAETLDMSKISEADKKYFPIKDFGAYTFDGDGCTITNLTTPLFEKTAAHIKNLKLTNVNIVETSRLHVGAFACDLHGTLEECEATGSLVYNNTAFSASDITDETANSKNGLVNIGGLVGQGGTAVVKNCTNNVNVVIKAVGTEELGVSIAVGGVIGGAHTESEIINVTNRGNVTFGNPEGADDAACLIPTLIDAGGILGRIIEYSGADSYVKTLTGCYNYGTLSTTKNFSATHQLMLAGITSRMSSYVTFSNNHNHGEIVHYGNSTTTLYMAGMIGYRNWSAIDGCTNNKPIHCEGTCNSLHIGGIIGQDVTNAISNCTNNAEGKLYCSANATIKTGVYIGGIAAGGTHEDYPKRATVTSCHNYAEIYSAGTSAAGDVSDDIRLAGIVRGTVYSTIQSCSNTGDIHFDGNHGNADGNNNELHIGGITATSIVADATIKECTNSGAIYNNGIHEKCEMGGIVGDGFGEGSLIESCTNSGAVYNNKAISKTFNVAGIAADGGNGHIKSCTNSGAIYNAATTGNFYAGGITTYNLAGTGYIYDCTNEGDVYTAKGATSATTYMAGILAVNLNSADAKIESCTNSGSIYNAGTASTLRLSGIVGVNVNSGILISCENTGKIENSGTASSTLGISGVVGGTVSAKVSDCKNTGAIINSGTNKDVLSLGGLVAYGTKAEIEDCHNEGAISHTGKSSAAVYVSGVVNNLVDYHDSNGVINGCTNKGTITLHSAETVTATSLYVGGITNYSKARIHGCENKAEGDIEVNGYTMSGSAWISGIAGWAAISASDSAANKWENNHNRGDIALKNITANTGNNAMNVGGLAGQTTVTGTITSANRTQWYNCSNEGKISTENYTTKIGSKKHGRLLIAGCFGTGYAGWDFVNCHNKGVLDIKVKMNSNVFAGGLMGYWGNCGVKDITCKIENCSNTKSITITSDTPTTPATTGGEGHLAGGIMAQTYMNNGYNQSGASDYVEEKNQILELTDVSNTGAITITGNTFGDFASHMAGGIAAYYYTYGTLTRCHNEAVVKIEPSVANTTVKTAYIGGIAGYACPKNNHGKEVNLVNCTNFSQIVAKSLNSTANLFIGGLVGNTPNSRSVIHKMDGCGNKGEVLVDGVTATGNAYIGGLVGYTTETTEMFLNTNVNIGNITVQNSTLADAKTWIGGIAGATTVKIANAQSFCSILATGYTNAAWIMGTNRTDTIIADKCKIGGTVLELENQNDPESELVEKDMFTNENFMDYIYGGSTSWTGTTYDGCELLPKEKKPSVVKGSAPIVQ